MAYDETTSDRGADGEGNACTQANALQDYLEGTQVLGDCEAVGRKWGVTEDTVRAWITEAMRRDETKPNELEQIHRANLREIRYRVAAGLKQVIICMQRRIAGGELKDADVERYATMLAKLMEEPESTGEEESESSGIVFLAKLLEEPEEGKNGG